MEIKLYKRKGFEDLKNPLKHKSNWLTLKKGYKYNRRAAAVPYVLPYHDPPLKPDPSNVFMIERLASANWC